MGMHRWLVWNVLFPLHEWAKGHPSFRILRDMEHADSLTAAGIAELRMRKLRGLLAYGSVHVPYLRDTLRERSLTPADFRTPEDLRRLPLMRKADVRRNRERLRSDIAGKLTSFSTGGSTGEPLIYDLPKERIASWIACRQRAMRWWGLSAGDREYAIWGSPVEVTRQDRIRSLRDRILATQLLSAFEMSESVMDGYLDILRRRKQFLSPSVLEASAKLAQVAPGQLQKSIFLSTGTEANEFAFRIAKAWTGRTSIVGLSRGYYGTSLATRSCSSLFSHRLKDTLPTVPGSLRIPISKSCSSCFTDSHDAGCGFPCLDAFAEQVGDWSDIAAIIAEPVLSAGGMLFPPSGYMARLKEMAKRNGALLIVDEAQTGFGRTGKWFAIEHHGVEPDVLTLSKSVGNGYAVAAVITTAEIADQVVVDGLWNLSSHQSDPVAAEAVAAVIDIAREENLPARAAETGAYFVARLRELSKRQSAVCNVRGLGLMIGFDCLPPEHPGREAEAANAFMHECRHRGLHLTYGYGGYNIRIIPPLVLSCEQVDFAVQTMDDALSAVLRSPAEWKNATPRNPHTSRAYAQNSWKRLLSHCWQTSPEQWVEKGSRLLSRVVR